MQVVRRGSSEILVGLQRSRVAQRRESGTDEECKKKSSLRAESLAASVSLVRTENLEQKLIYI